jgi:hypothetical protein
MSPLNSGVQPSLLTMEKIRFTCVLLILFAFVNSSATLGSTRPQKASINCILSHRNSGWEKIVLGHSHQI